MLRLASYDIVFREIPGEVTLALNISGCPNRCPGCHSPHLQEYTGEPLDDRMLSGLLDRYGAAVTCVCFMGGDGDPEEVARLAGSVKSEWGNNLRVGWYSGRTELPTGFYPAVFDYIKLGPYVEKLGGLDRETTNQRLYRVTREGMTDITPLFQSGRRHSNNS